MVARSTLDLLDWSSLIDSRTELSKHLVVPNMQVRRAPRHSPVSGDTRLGGAVFPVP